MNLAGMIDHTNLKAQATASDIDQLVAEAITYNFAAVCVNGCYVGQVAAALRDSPIKTTAVVDFPLGASKQSVKIAQALAACADGAQEIDFVAHLPTLLSKDTAATTSQFQELVREVRQLARGAIIKVILETAALMADVDTVEAERRIESACMAAQQAGCDFVKTSTGFHPAGGTGGATVQAVKLLKKYAGRLQVKASGGIRNFQDAMQLVEAGADRLGTSCGIAIIKEQLP